MATPRELRKAVQRELKDLPRLDTSSVRAIRRRFTKVLAGNSAEDVISFVRLLLSNGGWPERVVAWEILAGHSAAFARIDDQLIEDMAEGLSDWGSVDLFGVTVVGQAWREKLIKDVTVRDWARSPDRWRRRLALVSTVSLNSRARGGHGDSQRTLRVCRMLLEDRDPMVVKALSWALRELAKRNPIAVAEFLVENEARLAARITREVRNKMATGRKNPSP